jgi:hypothetical protein
MLSCCCAQGQVQLFLFWDSSVSIVSKLLAGLGAVFLGVMLPGCETDTSPLSSAKVKNLWHCTSLPYGMVITKHSHNLPCTPKMDESM